MKLKPLAIVLLAASAAACGVTPALAMKCGPRDQLRTAIEKGFGEERMWAGTSGQGQVMELFVRPDGRSWTLVLHGPDGVSCPVDSRGAWREFEPAPEPEGEGA